MLAIDANFKLKRKAHGHDDIELGEGWGYFVPNVPYKAFTDRFKDEEEVRTMLRRHRPFFDSLSLVSVSVQSL